MKYIITRLTTTNRVNQDVKLHYIFTDKEKPCEETFLEELYDIDGIKCSRYMININSIEELDKLGEKYNVDILVTRNNMFPEYIAFMLYDEELPQD